MSVMTIAMWKSAIWIKETVTLKSNAPQDAGLVKLKMVYAIQLAKYLNVIMTKLTARNVLLAAHFHGSMMTAAMRYVKWKNAGMMVQIAYPNHTKPHVPLAANLRCEVTDVAMKHAITSNASTTKRTALTDATSTASTLGSIMEYAISGATLKSVIWTVKTVTGVVNTVH